MPPVAIERPHICVEGLGEKRTGRDGSIRSVTFFILAMSLIKNTSPHSIQLIQGCKVYILSKIGKEKVKMNKPFPSSIYEVIGCYTVKVIHIGTE